MKHIFVLALLILMSISAFAQGNDHAPTVAQCQADGRLWNSQAIENVRFPDLTFKQLQARVNELLQCKTVDPSGDVDYSYGLDMLQKAQQLREMNFMDRHHLWPQFFAEDQQGKGRE